MQEWTKIIKPNERLFSLKLKEVLSYKDLIFLFVRRDFVSLYKQTILGPIWFVIQPVLTTITFTVVFGKFAGISTDGVPQVLFYMSGLTVWNYFSETLTKTADTFIANASIFGKVYFPRLIVPLSVVISNLYKLLVQIFIFLAFWLYYYVNGEVGLPDYKIILLPIIVLLFGFIGLGFGILISAMTTKYRDLRFVISFGVQLLMYATPIVYPLAIVNGTFKKIICLNPITGLVEGFRNIFTGSGTWDWGLLAYSLVFAILINVLGISVFNKVEKSFNDTV